MVLIHLQRFAVCFPVSVYDSCQFFFVTYPSTNLCAINNDHGVHVTWAFLLGLIIYMYLKTVKDSKDHHPEKGFNPNLANYV